MTTTKRRLLRGSYQNIIDLYDRTPDHIKIEGEAWYPDAHIIAQNVGEIAMNGTTLTDHKRRKMLLGAGIISAFSPQMVWEKNIRAANIFARDIDTKPVWITNRDYEKAISMVKGFCRGVMSTDFIMEQLGEGALKTRPFFMNILNPEGNAKTNGITIDRHAIAVYLGEVPTPLQVGRAFSPNGNSQKQNSYKIASDKLGGHHNTVQATTWLEWRSTKGNKNDNNI